MVINHEYWPQLMWYHVPGFLSHPIPTNRTCPSESTPEIREALFGALRGRAVHHRNALGKRSLLRLLRGERDMFQHFPIESMVIGICSIIFPYFQWSLGWFREKKLKETIGFPIKNGWFPRNFCSLNQSKGNGICSYFREISRHWWLNLMGFMEDCFPRKKTKTSFMAWRILGDGLKTKHHPFSCWSFTIWLWLTVRHGKSQP